MNFNEPKALKTLPSSNFLTSPTGAKGPGFEDQDFYESLNYSKFA
jgi:hypothetical protein